MIRELETVQNKPVELLLTSAVVKKGAPVDVDSEDQTVKATAEGLGTKLCDVNAKYEGIYSIVEPTDGEFEEAAVGERVRVIQTLRVRCMLLPSWTPRPCRLATSCRPRTASS